MRDIKSVMTLRFSFRIPLWLLLAMISLVFCTPNVVSGAKGYYYYLHISSFRLDERAARDVKTLRRKGYNAITKREQVPNKGYWYRVYIGPFSSLGEAKLKREELRRKKLVDYVAIHKKESLISVDLEERKVPIEVEKPPPEVSIPAEVTPAVPE
ncbi:MAG: SPOR domain-containing protein [Candidatus Aerophobus sp.]|nr:MAG: SPOR domain-containing protein [Candidatus Aerophobus sp.]